MSSSESTVKHTTPLQQKRRAWNEVRSFKEIGRDTNEFFTGHEYSDIDKYIGYKHEKETSKEEDY